VEEVFMVKQTDLVKDFNFPKVQQKLKLGPKLLHPCKGCQLKSECYEDLKCEYYKRYLEVGRE
jgi:hypothetical protein